jgi:hypothetical protein
VFAPTLRRSLRNENENTSDNGLWLPPACLDPLNFQPRRKRVVNQNIAELGAAGRPPGLHRSLQAVGRLLALL